jgi:hypothetical protein
MQMPKQTFYAMVNRHGGWIEGDIARFPSVAQKDAFNRECDEYASAVKEGRVYVVPSRVRHGEIINAAKEG